MNSEQLLDIKRTLSMLRNEIHHPGANVYWDLDELTDRALQAINDELITKRATTEQQ